MSLSQLICSDKKNKINNGVFIPLKTGCLRQPLGAGGVSLKGFSLVELLIAVAIFSVVSIAIYATFSSGAAVLRRVRNTDLTEQKILLRIERLSRELREQPACRKPLFQGEKTKISFCANIDNLPYRLTYYFDNKTNVFKRQSDRLSKIIEAESSADPQLRSSEAIFLSNVKEVNFSYLYLNLTKNEYLWTDQWQNDYLPLAVKFIIFSQKKNYASTVYNPRT
jgi:prepilin-type N-terminal cleavage/methylation domain-containing protein